MVFFEVITDFKIQDFDVIKQNISLEKVSIFTSDLSIKENIEKLGYKVNLVDDYFGYTNPKIYSIYENAIKNKNTIEALLRNTSYKNVPLEVGLEFQILFTLVFIEEIKEIFGEKHNIVFLFPNTEYHYFLITQIAKENHYDTKFGISYVLENTCKSLFFDASLLSDSRFIYSDTKFVYSREVIGMDDEFNVLVDSLLSKIDLSILESEFGFFLNDNSYGLYLKPVIPVLEKFKEKNVRYTIFTTDSWSANMMIKNGHMIYDLSPHIDNITKLMLEKKTDVISSFFENIQNTNKNNYIVESFLKIGKNDSMVRSLARILAIITIVDFIFSKIKFKAILLALDASPDNDVVCRVAKNHSIISHSIIIQSYSQYLPFLSHIISADIIFVGGKRLQKELQTLGIDKNRLVVTGNPRYDYIFRKKTINKSEKPFDSRKLILFTISRWHKNYEDWLPGLIRFCNQNNLEIIIKMHPMYKTVLKETIDHNITVIKKKCKGLKFQILFDPGIESILPRTDIVVLGSLTSTVGFEALLFNLPMIVANVSEHVFYDFTIQYHKENVALYASTLEELFDGINKIMKGSADEKLKRGRKKFNSDLNYVNDGKSAERIFQFITSQTIAKRLKFKIFKLFKDNKMDKI